MGLEWDDLLEKYAYTNHKNASNENLKKIYHREVSKITDEKYWWDEILITKNLKKAHLLRFSENFSVLIQIRNEIWQKHFYPNEKSRVMR